MQKESCFEDMANDGRNNISKQSKSHILEHGQDKDDKHDEILRAPDKDTSNDKQSEVSEAEFNGSSTVSMLEET